MAKTKPQPPQAQQGIIKVPYRPRAVFVPFHERKTRWAAIVAHRRCGKTYACVNDLIRAAVLNNRALERPDQPPQYAYIGPTYAQVKRTAWGYLKHFSAPLRAIFSEVDLSAKFPNGSVVTLHGAENYERLRGTYLDGIVIDEPAGIDPTAWTAVIRPTLADHEGWAVFIGTPSGHDHFYRLFYRLSEDGDHLGDGDQWTLIELKASETGLIPDNELEDAKREMGEETFLQEFECSFEAAIKGAYYGLAMRRAEEEKRVNVGVPYDEAVPVTTAWDLGRQGATVIWFAQVCGREIHLIDYYESAGMGLDHYVKVLLEKPYLYDMHIFPHDVSVTELSTNKSRIETLYELGVDPVPVPKLPLEDGINAVRLMLSRCWWDRKCSRGVEALKMYQSDYDERNRVLKLLPVHNWASHPADAFRVLAIGLDENPKPIKISGAYSLYENRRKVRGTWGSV